MNASNVVHLRSRAEPEPDIHTGSLFFIGTATVILRYGGFTILTDPNFLHQGDHVHLGYGLRSERLTEPAIPIEELPPLDLIVLSHYHGDHFDRIAEEKLDRDLPIVTTKHAATALAAKGFRHTHALETWESQVMDRAGMRLTITSMPGRHGPGPVNFLLPPVMGSMLDFSRPGGPPLLRVYITGDTLMHAALAEIPRRFPGVDLMLLHLGGTRVLGVMLTMDAEQGVRMLKLVQPRAAVPIHYNDYTVFRSPLEDFRRAAEAASLPVKLTYLAHGETHFFAVDPQRRAAAPPGR